MGVLGACFPWKCVNLSPLTGWNGLEILKMSRFCERCVFWNGCVRKENHVTSCPPPQPPPPPCAAPAVITGVDSGCDAGQVVWIVPYFRSWVRVAPTNPAVKGFVEVLVTNLRCYRSPLTDTTVIGEARPRLLRGWTQAAGRQSRKRTGHDRWSILFTRAKIWAEKIKEDAIYRLHYWSPTGFHPTGAQPIKVKTQSHFHSMGKNASLIRQQRDVNSRRDTLSWLWRTGTRMPPKL